MSAVAISTAGQYRWYLIQTKPHQEKPVLPVAQPQKPADAGQ